MSVENIVVDIEINNSLAPDIERSIVATIDNNINVIKDDTDDLDVTINRKEYVITGDEIYIPKRYEDAPTWLQNMIDQVVEYSIGAKVSDMNQVVYSLNQMIEAMEVSKNTYEMSVISSNDIDTRINTAITTLNSNMNDADATILSVANTKTTPEEAEAIMINAVRAELESTEAGTIGASVATLSTAISNEEEARSTSVETLYSTMEGEFEATATAFNTINTYIGIDEAGASTGTGLSAYIEGADGTFGSAGSELNNQIVATAEQVESKFAYNSTLKINGVPYTSGFGLATSQIAGSGVPEGQSEFWVTADKFKLRAASQTAASQQPFTVDAVTGDITFEGKVTFSSVVGGQEAIDSNSELNNDLIAQRLGYDDYADMINAALSGNTIINGGYVNTGLINAGAISASQINTIGLIAENINSNTIVGNTIQGSDIIGVNITGSVIEGARINGAVIKASYLDLDGELEVLTNYHITIAMYNANPSLYTDAVFIAPDNEYRIPSISTINYYSTGVAFSNIYTNIWSYDKGNAGINTKAVKIRPVIQFNDSLEFESPSFSPSNSYSAGLYFGEAHFISFSLTFSGSTARVNIYRAGESTLQYATQSEEVGYFTCSGVQFEYNLYGGGGFTLKSIGASPVFALPTDFVNGRVQITRGGTIASSGSVRMPSFTVFNML